jgi:hypothetical protein
MGASIAAIHAAHAAVDGDAERAAQQWVAVLTVAVPHRYLLLVCDALEALGCLASQRGDPPRAARLLSAAAKCRAGITYRWRFGFEQRQVDQAWATAGPAAWDGPVLSWQQAAETALE